MIGTLEEASAIYYAISSHSGRSEWVYSKCSAELPEGWTFLGAGRDRTAFLSPSGVVYKVCHYYYNSETSNDIEHSNFQTIEKSGKLPVPWKVPKSHLHCFNRYHGLLGKRTERIVVMACDYVKGERWSSTYYTPMYEAFSSVGLSDTFEGNAISGEDGFNYIIDAAEGRVSFEEDI